MYYTNIFRRFILILTALYFCASIFGQDIQEKVILKNGKVIEGKIIEYVTDKYVKIQTSTTLYNIKAKYIKEVIRSGDNTISEDITKDKFKTRGLFFMVEGGFSKTSENFDSDTYYESSIYPSKANTFNPDENFEILGTIGYKFKPYFTIGFSSGLYIVDEENLLPLMLYLRSELLNKRISPFIDMRFGSIIGMSDFIDGGLSCSLGAGIKCNITRKLALNISGGLKITNLWKDIITTGNNNTDNDEYYENYYKINVDNNNFDDPNYNFIDTYLKIGINF